MTKPTTVIGALTCAGFLLSLYAFAVFEPAAADQVGPLRVSQLWVPGLLCLPALCSVPPGPCLKVDFQLKT